MEFKENIKDIHIGTIIEQIFRERGMTITEFASKIKRERTTPYDIFTRKSIDTELLIEISKVLNYDFIRNVYLDEKTVHTIQIAIKTEEDVLKNLDLLEELIRFVRNKK